MSDLRHIYICIKVKKVERGGNRAYAVWMELDLGVLVEGNEKESKVIRAKRSENGVKRYI